MMHLTTEGHKTEKFHLSLISRLSNWWFSYFRMVEAEEVRRQPLNKLKTFIPGRSNKLYTYAFYVECFVHLLATCIDL